MDIFTKNLSAQQNSGAAWSYADTGDITRYEVRGGDHWSNQIDRERSETASLVRWQSNQSIDISYSMMVEPGAKNTASWLLLNQFVSAPGAGGQTWSPPFAIEMAGETMRIVVRSSTDKVMTTNPDATVIWKDSSPIDRGHMYDFDIKITFDPYGNGSVTVTRDGVALVHYEGPLGYVDNGGYYWKEGIYRSTSNETIAADFGEVQMHYSEVNGQGKITTGTALSDTLWGTGGKDLIYGLGGDDKLYGHDGDDQLYGGDGNDILSGMSGADTLDGGAGNDTADYSLSNAGINIALGGAVGRGGHAEGDTLINIEKIIGSNFNDVIKGDAGWNHLQGLDGDDWFEGGGSGDFIDGGNGIDTVSYVNSNSSVSVSLLTGTGTGGHAQGNVLTSIENLEGSKFNDVLTGNGFANVLSGGAGHDVLSGGAGNDTLMGGDGNDTLIGGDGLDTLFGDAGNDVLIGGKGDDSVDGGAGSDSFLLAGSSRDYVISFNADGSLQIKDGIVSRDGVDTLRNVEYLSFKDGTVKVADLSTEQITKVFDTSFKLTGYNITLTAGDSVQYKHYDASWNLTSAEMVTQEGSRTITRTYDANWTQTGVQVETPVGNKVICQIFDKSFSKVLSTTTKDPVHQTEKVDYSGTKQTTTFYDEHGVKTGIDIQTIESSGTVIKHYDANMKWLSNTIEVDRGSYTDIKQYDANWKLTSYVSIQDPTLKVGHLYQDTAHEVSTSLEAGAMLKSFAGSAEYLSSYGHLGHWDLV